MAIFTDHYGTLVEAQDYFDNRLHEFAWSDTKPIDRPKGLIFATRIIDTLNFKGNKAAIHTLLANAGCSQDIREAIDCGCIAQSAVQAASLTQPLEFPRGQDTGVPGIIKCATFEIAHSLLDGKDPELELENLGVISQGYASVRTTYSRGHVPVEHIVNYVPNALAWRWLRPFLRDEDAVILTRVI